MQKRLILAAEGRAQTGKSVRKLRKEGKIPAVLYGHNVASLTLTVDRRQFTKAFDLSGESTLIDLVIGADKPRTVLVHDVQRHFLKNDYTHVDFYQVDMSEKIKAPIALEFVGESKAVKDLGGVLVKVISEVEVESLPGDLPRAFNVDISGLNTFEDSITVSDLAVDAEKVRVINRPEEIVAKVIPPRSEEELKELQEKPVVEEVSSVEGVVKEEPAAESGESTAKEQAGT